MDMDSSWDFGRLQKLDKNPKERYSEKWQSESNFEFDNENTSKQ